MARTFIKNINYIAVAWMLLLISTSNVIAQSYPEIPESISFGGITVKLDRSAQDIIEEDVRNLMSNKKFWEEKMDRAVLHFPIVEGILMDEEVPIDFKYLAVQESSFRPDVVSTSNAVGYWQFKPETARELNLRVDDDIDERKNISASTHAAAVYLKRNNQQFNNWVTTLYSYYQGAGGVKKVVPANWAYAREVTLNGKTDRYMLRFFAHKIALEAGIERYKTANKLVLLEANYGKGKSLDDISSSLGVAPADLKSYNRWLTDDKIPNDRQYMLTIPIPADQLASVREKLSLPPQQTAIASVYEDTGYPVLKKMPAGSDPNGPERYEINGLAGVKARSGDKPKTLASAGDMSAPKFMRYNDMLAEMPLIPGQVYYLAKKHKKASTPFHTARPGDTWHSVSQQYGIRLVSLLKYNRTTSRNYPIQTGQVLFLTKKRPRKQPIEIIAPPQPSPGRKDSVIAKKEDVIASAPVATNTNVIPDKPSGRKKYTPVLVEKKEETASEPVTTPPVSNAPVAAATPAAANIQTTPSAKTATNVPASVPTEPVSTQAGDRVVIITQDNADTSFKSSEEPPVTSSTAPAKVVTPNDTRVASETSVYMKQQRAAAEEKAASPEKAATHTVQPGDTYFSVASKYDLTLRELIALNKNSPGRLVVGQRLNVSKGAPTETASAAPTRETPARTNQEPEKITVVRTEPAETFKTPEEVKHETRAAASSGNEYHVVQGGQTYYSISKSYGLSVQELYELNNLSPASALKSGQRLRVRRADSEVPAPVRSSGSRSAATQTHTVAPGETLFRISQTYHTNVEDIKRLNNMSGNSVMVGQKLKIPQQ